MSENIIWHNPNNEPFRIYGFAWLKELGKYRRLPVKTDALPIPEAVDELANHTSGGQIRFATDSKKIIIKATLAGPADMCHMPATGQCGFDCYIYAGGKPRFAGCAKYEAREVFYECEIFEQPEAVMREVIINFPLYIGVEKAEVGLLADAEIRPPSTIQHGKRCVVYGTSITQGGCASRPGMSYTNILSRRLGIECINLGFSGSGRGEPVMAELVASIPDAGCFILDYEANAGYEQLEQTMPHFLQTIRNKNPFVPIIVVSKTAYAHVNFSDEAFIWQNKCRELQRGFVCQRESAGDDNIYFMDGSKFFGEDFDECTVDGAHPTDLGFIRIADILAPEVANLMGLRHH